MFGIGLPEMTIVLVIVLVVVGAAKLPALGTGLGKSIQNFKKEVTASDQTSNEKLIQKIEG